MDWLHIEEKVRIIAKVKSKDEFGSDTGKVMIVKKALYGLKSSGAAFWAMLTKTIYDVGYRPTKADPDVWIRPAVKPDGFQYYELVLVYVDGVISISVSPMDAIKGIKAVFKLKGDKAELPDMYLGGGLSIVETASGTKCWTMSAEKYIKTPVTNVEENLAKL